MSLNTQDCLPDASGHEALIPPAATPQGSVQFHDLLMQVIPSLRQQAFALSRNRADAEDLVQAAVTNALAAQASFTMGTNFRAWMARILRNLFVSNIRRRRETIDIDDAPASLLGRSGGQDERLELLELRRCMLRLSAKHRHVLVLISVQGLSYEEASEVTGVAVGTLKCWVFRARAQLAAWMLGEEPAGRARPASTRRKPSVDRALRAGYAVSANSNAV